MVDGARLHQCSSRCSYLAPLATTYDRKSHRLEGSERGEFKTHVGPGRASNSQTRGLLPEAFSLELQGHYGPRIVGTLVLGRTEGP